MTATNLNLLLSSFMYSLPFPQKTRTRPFRLLCLGLPRSATECLHNALHIPDYPTVAHGIPWWLSQAGTSPLYYRLALLRAHNQLPSPQTTREQYFDRTLGKSSATTDIPCAWFAEELLAAYPDGEGIMKAKSNAATLLDVILMMVA